MIAKLYIPTINTENGKFETDINITADEYRQMTYDNFIQNNTAINNYMNGYDRRGYRNQYAVDNDTYRDNYDGYPEIEYDENECECLLLDIKKDDITKTFFEEYYSNGKMTLLIVNINPETLDGETESELRFWLDDSRRIHDDNTLDDMTKLKYLPKRSFKIKVDNDIYTLVNCKMVENRSDNKFPFNFVIIIEKINK